MTAFTVNLRQVVELTDEQFFNICRNNPELKFERSAHGELVIVSPTGAETGNHNFELYLDIGNWNRRTKLGKGFDSSTSFKLPNGAIRSPDIAWVEKSRWDGLTSIQKQRFAPICPDFVVELMSPSDILSVTQAKMREYMENGAKLGWLINSEAKQVEIYRIDRQAEILDNPPVLSGEDILPGFKLDLAAIW